MSDQVKYGSKLHGRRLLVLGGSSGIGFAVAEAALESGAIVIVSSSNQSRIDTTVSRLQQSYPSRKAQVSGFACNLGDDSTMESNIVKLLKNSTQDGAKKLDHIVFTAADKLSIKELKDFDIAGMHAAGRIRFYGPLLVGKHLPEYMRISNESSFTMTTGAVSEHPIPKWTVVGSFATGLQGMARQMGLDLAPIRVNCVSPGAVETELWDEMEPDAKKQFLKSMGEGMTTGKVPGPEDIAEAYLYLMRDHNITGSMISTNGGHLLK